MSEPSKAAMELARAITAEEGWRGSDAIHASMARKIDAAVAGLREMASWADLSDAEIAELYRWLPTEEEHGH